jgi:serine carboxypeptidase-like clade 1
MVYIDSPAGTGFSYTPGEVGYYTSDDKTIEDLVVFVAGFFDEHPWLVRQPLYVAGENRELLPHARLFKDLEMCRC